MLHPARFADWYTRRAGVFALPVKSHEHMGGGHGTDHFEQCAHKSQGSLDGLAPGIGNPGRHSVEHLKEQIASVHDEQLHPSYLLCVFFTIIFKNRLLFWTISCILYCSG